MPSAKKTADDGLPLGSQVSDCLILKEGGDELRNCDEYSEASNEAFRVICAQTCVVRCPTPMPCPSLNDAPQRPEKCAGLRPRLTREGR